MKIWTKEPLLHFLLIGAALFFLFGWRSGPPTLPGDQTGSEPGTIVVAQNDIEQLVETFTRTWQRPPTEEEVNGLVESFVRDEIYFREAMAIGLDRDDSVIRRRLRLKMEYIFEDIAAQREPTEAELADFFQKNGERYLIEPRLAFHQVYVSMADGGAKAQKRAQRIRAELEAGSGPDALGDPFLLGPEIPLSTLSEIRQQFGDGFGKSLRELQAGSWQGPLASGYGLHLVLVTQSSEKRLPEMDEVREIVKRDWAAARQRELKDAAYARLRERYRVVMEKPDFPATAEIAEAAPGTVTR